MAHRLGLVWCGFIEWSELTTIRQEMSVWGGLYILSFGFESVCVDEWLVQTVSWSEETTR